MALRRSFHRLISIAKRRYCCNSTTLYHLGETPRIILFIPPDVGENTAKEQDAFQSNVIQTARNLQDKHTGHFMIHDVSTADIPHQHFGGTIVKIGSHSNFRPASHAPALENVVSLCRAAHSWLTMDAENVAVICCDRAQASVLLSCVQIYCQEDLGVTISDVAKWYVAVTDKVAKHFEGCRLLRDHHQFLRCFSKLRKRVTSKLGTSGTSSAPISWTSLPDFVRNLGPNEVWQLRTVRLTSLPKVVDGRWRPCIMVIQNESVVYSNMSGRVTRVPSRAKSLDIDVGVPADGDLIFRLYHLPEGRPGILLASFSFHTAFAAIRSDTRSALFKVKKKDVDDLAKSSTFEPDLVIEFTWGVVNKPEPEERRGSTTLRQSGQATTSRASEESIDTIDTANDEDFARHLQEQFDLEERQAQEQTEQLRLQMESQRERILLVGDEPGESTTDDPIEAIAITTTEDQPPADAEDTSVLDISADEEFARSLQAQLDSEAMEESSRNEPEISPSEALRRLAETDAQFAASLQRQMILAFADSPVAMHRRGDARLLSTLPVSLVAEDNSHMLGQECQICCDFYEVGQQFKTLPCLHFYHPECIDPWLQQKANCPICQHPVHELGSH